MWLVKKPKYVSALFSLQQIYITHESGLNREALAWRLQTYAISELVIGKITAVTVESNKFILTHHKSKWIINGETKWIT